jgi:hypothetical protein
MVRVAKSANRSASASVAPCHPRPSGNDARARQERLAHPRAHPMISAPVRKAPVGRTRRSGCVDPGRLSRRRHASAPTDRAVNPRRRTGRTLQEIPTPGYMRLLKESVLQIWKARKAAVREEIAGAERAAKAIQTSWTVWTRRSSSSARSTSRPTTVTRRNCARSSRSPGSTDTQGSSKNSTWKASWRSQNAFCRAPPISGCRRHSNSGSGSNNCSFQMESRSTEKALLEPA